ncbi:hypothetical protein J6590_088157 [Homalodisca vitripennis]|nr:hypothetical protein J6590_088157 [Homalodisca vitripennis]
MVSKVKPSAAYSNLMLFLLVLLQGSHLHPVPCSVRCTGEITTLYYKVFAGECAEVTSSSVAGTTVTYCLWRGVLTLAPLTPRAQTSQMRTVLDIGPSGSLDGQSEVFAVFDLSPDHVPVFFHFPDDGVTSYPPIRPTKINWHQFANHLADRHWPLPTPAESTDQLDQQVLDLTTTHQKAMTASSSTLSRMDISSPLPEHLREEVRLRRRMRREYQQSRCPHASRPSTVRPGGALVSWRNTERLRGMTSWNIKLTVLSAASGKSKGLSEGKISLTDHFMASMELFSLGDRAEAFADIMEDQLSTLADVYDEDTCEIIGDFLEGYQPDDDDPLPHVTTFEVLAQTPWEMHR